MTKLETIDTAALSNVSGGAAAQWGNWQNTSTGWNAPQQWASSASKWAAPAASGAWAGAQAGASSWWNQR